MYANAEPWAANGFEIHEQLISADLLDQFNIEFEGLVKNILKRAGIETDDPLHAGMIALDELDHSWVHSIYNTLRGCDALNRIAFSDGVVDAVKSILGVGGSEMILNTYSIVRIDPPQDPRFLYKWHQESYYSIPGSESVQVWAPLVGRNTSEMGTIEVLAGSHEKEVGHYIERVPDGHQQCFIHDWQMGSRYEGMLVELDPGDAVLFHPFLVHKSRTNVSNKVRYSLVAHYINPSTDAFKIEAVDYPAYHKRRTINYQEFVSA